MAKSIIYTGDRCFNCGAKAHHIHHIFNGYGLRQKSEEDGLTIPLCAWCHDYTHTHKEQLLAFKKLGQKAFLLKIGSQEEFLKRYHKNYLELDEIEKWERLRNA